MFKLLSGARKGFRGFKVLAEVAYVQIGLFGGKLQGDDKHTTHITLRLWSDDNKDYLLIVPEDKIESVISRLQDAKNQLEVNRRAASNFNRNVKPE